MNFAVTLRELGSVIIFLGVLANNNTLVSQSPHIVEELSALGYNVPKSDSPVRVAPAQTAGDFSSQHAGGWRPGTIYLREADDALMLQTLRHELMHEALQRTCGNKLPNWAMEATAISFSGEASDETFPGPDTHSNQADAHIEKSIAHLLERTRKDAPLDPPSYKTLIRLVNQYGWPKEPCAINEALLPIFSNNQDYRDTPFSYLIMHLSSARILAEKGDIKTPLPPGSLLKVPYVASLENVDPALLGKALAESDTRFLCSKIGNLHRQSLKFFLSPLLARRDQKSSIALDEELSQCHELLGERNKDRVYPLLGSLTNIALTLRASLLSSPQNFSQANQNGVLPKSTLFGSGSSNLQLILGLRAFAKTGTTATSLGDPLVAHLALTWPVEEPLYLAIFHQGSKQGRDLLEPAASVLRNFSRNHPVPFGKVRVSLLGALEPTSWGIEPVCPEFNAVSGRGQIRRASLCGAFKVISNAPQSKTNRLVYGIIDQSEPNRSVIETDPETYTDSVLIQEDDTLSGELLKAFRSIVTWNATRAGHRHSNSDALCDTTHCMVFAGMPLESLPAHGETTDTSLLELLDRVAYQNHLDWLQFSKGGGEPWEVSLTEVQLLAILNEPSLIDIQISQAASNSSAGSSGGNSSKTTKIELIYPESDETVSCEYFRNRLKLPSCPETATNDRESHSWTFRGHGEGHGTGLDLSSAKRLGFDAATILKHAYCNGNTDCH